MAAKYSAWKKRTSRLRMSLIFAGVGVAFVVREVQATPNPNAVKILLDCTIATQAISRRAGAVRSDAAVGGLDELAEQLLAVKGVSAVLLLNDFITINKSSEARWADINRKVKQILAKTKLHGS